MQDLAQHIKRALSEMAGARTQDEQVWKDCYDFTFPERAHGLLSQILNATDAQNRKNELFDDTAGDSCQVGAASIMGAMIPASARWFDLDAGQESNEEQAYLDEFAKIQWENIHASGFDAEAFDAMLDMWIAGWFVLYCDERDEGGYYFELFPLGQCYFRSSRSGNTVDTLYREYIYSTSQVVAEFGIDKVSDKVRNDYNAQKFDTKVRLVHAIEPRQMHAVGAKMAKNLPVASVHMELDTLHILKESGFHEFPCMVPRWSRLPSGYATGPMSRALATTRTLNEVAKWSLMGAETAIAPPLKVVDDGVINPRNIRMGPRKILVCGDINNIEPLMTGAKVEVGELSMERMQGAIRKILLADQLPPADGPVKTAYEWSVRVETIRKMLGPMFGRFQSEFLQPLVERTFGILWRANERSGWALAGKPPASLLGRAFTVKYLSPLARSQRLEDVAAMDRFEQALGLEAQVAGAQILDVYDFEAAARERSKLLGVPQRLMRDDRAMKIKREADQEAAQQAMAAQQQAGAQQEMQGAMAQRIAQGA